MRILIGSIIGLCLLGCDAYPDTAVPPIEGAASPLGGNLSASVRTNYTVLSDQAQPPLKRSINVRLSQKLTEEELAAVAYELRRTDPRVYDRTFITFYLPDQQVGAGAWATGHFNPDLKVVIQGLSADEEARLRSKEAAYPGDTVGHWIDDRPFVGNLITIYRSKGKLVIVRQFNDGSKSETELRERTASNGTRLEEVDNELGEYYLINRAGDLEVWDPDGLITTSRKIR